MIISKYTDHEFREGIKGHIDKIRNFNTPRINSIIFQEVQVQKDIFNFYHKWRIGKINTNLDKFLAEVLSLYDNFKREFKINTEMVLPYDIEETSIKELLNDYTSKISSFKTSEGHFIIGSAIIDANNILWVEKKRGYKNQNIFDTKFFFISTDQGLRRWDYQRVEQTPIVLLPSQWMSILLRYVNRTDDDFKSFVSFLNLKNNEVLITSEKLHIVLAGISEMTTDIIQQRTLLNNLIQNKFDGVVYKGSSNDQIFNNAKSYAESELEKLVGELQRKNDELHSNQEKLSSTLEIHKKSVSSEIEQIKEDRTGISNKLKNKEDENKRLKENLISYELISEFKRWQRTAYAWGLVGIVFIIYFILLFTLIDWEYNYPHQLNIWKDSISNSLNKQIIKGLMYSPLFGLWLISQNFIWKRLISSEMKTEKKRKIKKEIIEENK